MFRPKTIEPNAIDEALTTEARELVEEVRRLRAKVDQIKLHVEERYPVGWRPLPVLELIGALSTLSTELEMLEREIVTYDVMTRGNKKQGDFGSFRDRLEKALAELEALLQRHASLLEPAPEKEKPKKR